MTNSRHALMASLDVFISFIFIGPCGVFYWRGVWGNMDVYLYSDSPKLSILVSFSIGTIITIFLCIIKARLKSFTDSMHNHVVYFIFSRCYTYICGFAVINKWRGIWLLQDHFTGMSSMSALASYVVGVCTLSSFRCLQSAITPPLVVLDDRNKDDLCEVKTRFSSKVGCNSKFMCDMLLSNLILNNAVVVLWRGAWTLQDALFIEYDTAESAFLSLYIACTLAFPLLLGQNFLRRMSRYFHKWSKISQLLLEIFGINVACVLSISFWRGVWLLQDALLIPSNRETSCWISHVTGYVGLTLLFVTRSFTTFDCVMDTDIVKGSDAIFDITFFEKIKLFYKSPNKGESANRVGMNVNHAEQIEPLQTK